MTRTKYAQGETIKHPMGFDITIDTPMDFMGVTDHSEYVGVTKQANTPGSYVSTLPEAQPMIMKDPTSQDEQNRVFSYLLKLGAGAPVKAFMDPKITATVWNENVKLADVKITGSVVFDPKRDDVASLELVQNGTVIDRFSRIGDAARIEFAVSRPVDASSWFALRGYGTRFDENAFTDPIIFAPSSRRPTSILLRSTSRRRMGQASGRVLAPRPLRRSTWLGCGT
jgi:hypothetical protein